VKEAKHIFVIRLLEETIRDEIEIDGYSINLKGRIDRIDYTPEDNCYMIIDYKTGGVKQYSDVSVKPFDTSSIYEIHKNIDSLQLPVYVYLFQNRFKIPLININAQLVLLQKNDRDILFKTHANEEVEKTFDFYLKCINTVLFDIFDRSKCLKSFDDDYCPKCNFNMVCRI